MKENEPSGLTSTDLIQAANAKGHAVTERQLERWRKAGLIPGSTKIYPGNGGSFALYPPHTLPQLLAFCCLDAHTRRNLSAIRLMLFFAGFPIPEKRIKESVRDIYLRPMQRLNTGQDALDSAEKIVERQKTHSRAFRRMSKTLKSDADAESFFITMYRLLLGDVPPMNEPVVSDAGERNLAEIIMALLVPDLPTKKNIPDALQEMAEVRFLSLSDMAHDLDTAAETDLLVARDVVCRMQIGISDVFIYAMLLLAVLRLGKIEKVNWKEAIENET